MVAKAGIEGGRHAVEEVVPDLVLVPRLHAALVAAAVPAGVFRVAAQAGGDVVGLGVVVLGGLIVAREVVVDVDKASAYIQFRGGKGGLLLL